MDPYVYECSNVLKNKLNIRDEKELIVVEAQLLIAAIVEIDEIYSELDFSHISSLRNIHSLLFQSIYDWAGEFRTVDIYKSEEVLGGVSISYSAEQFIKRDLELIFEWASTVDWSLSDDQLATNFSKFMTDIWRVHPFREGNTRTVSIFMKLFSKDRGIQFNEQLLSRNAGYVRNALVLAAVEEAPEPEHLLKIITDALGLTETESLPEKNANDEKYKTIGQYHVSSYEEKPFLMENLKEE